MQMLLKTAYVTLLSSFLLHSATAADAPFVTVNGNPVSQAAADIFIKQAKAHGVPSSPELKEQVREELIKRELLWQAARKAGIDRKPEVSAHVEAEKQKMLVQAELARQTLIVRAYVEDYLRQHPVSDVDLKDEYQKLRAKGGSTDFKLRHILLQNEKDAKAVIVRLNGGAKFEDMAKQSMDASSEDSGGDLGWSTPGKFVKPFAEAVTSLKPGKYTPSPVKTEFGYHVIRLDEVRPLRVPAFEEMKPLLKRQVEEQNLRKMVDGLRSKANIE